MPSGRAMEQRAWFARGVVVRDGARVKIADLKLFFLKTAVSGPEHPVTGGPIGAGIAWRWRYQGPQWSIAC